MIISLLTKKPFRIPALVPPDFYRFRHRYEMAESFGHKMAATRPLWIIGVSPFDPIISGDDGYVVHLGSPRFTARWSMDDNIINQIRSPDYFDEDLNILIYETLLMDETTGDLEEWFLEAVCAVAYSRGLIAVAAQDEEH
ncbi:MAG: hypothetical protein WDO70_04510 [Alphaproteobacteria bacterium]